MDKDIQNQNQPSPAVAGQVEFGVRPTHWSRTVEGRQCHCNYCYTQFQTRQDFGAHWPNCPVRVRIGYAETTIYAA